MTYGSYHWANQEPLSKIKTEFKDLRGMESYFVSMMINKDTNLSTMEMTGQKKRRFAKIYLSRPINANLEASRKSRDLRTQVYENFHRIVDFRSHLLKLERADLQY